MKTNAIIRIILFSLAILVLISILLGVVTYDSFVFDRHSVTVRDEIEVSNGTQVNFSGKAADIQHLEIEWAAGSITILPNSGSDQILISESVVSDEKYAMHITQSGNKLKIEFNDEDMSFVRFGINHTDAEAKDLVISVPADWICNSLEIDAAAADVKITGITIRDVEFDGASGICTFEDCQIRNLDIDTASGDVEFSGTLDELDFDAMSARFTGTFQNIPNRINMDSMSGNLELYLPENCGFSLELDAMSSDFNSDFPAKSQNGHYTYGDGHCRIHISAMSGDVAIYKTK